jgi:hypothetical protein
MSCTETDDPRSEGVTSSRSARRPRAAAAALTALLVLGAAPATAPAAASPGSGAIATAPACGNGPWVDYNGDGCPDIAIGAPDFDVNGADAAGLVQVRYGVSSTGYSTTQTLAQGSVIGASAEPGDRFGTALAAGDFDGDGYHDLAVGVPGEDVGSVADAGAVHIVLGSAAGLGRGARPSFWLQQGTTPRTGAPETGDTFGAALDADSRGLIVGAPYEDVGSAVDAGAAMHYLFSGQGQSFAVVGHFLAQGSLDAPWTPDHQIRGTAERGDHFGAAVSIWGPSIGAPDEDLPDPGAEDDGLPEAIDAGVVNRATGHYYWSQLQQGEDGIQDSEENGDRFGAALGHLVGGCWERGLIIGAPGEAIGAVARAGAVFQLNDENQDSGPIGNMITQDSPGVPGIVERDDRFGSSVLGVQEAGDGALMVAIGTPGEDVGSVVDAGSVTEVAAMAVPGCAAPQPAARLWTQESPGVPGAPEAGDRYGTSVSAVSAGNLIVGVPGEDGSAGAVIGPVDTAGGFWQSSPVQPGARYGAVTLGPAR